MSGRGIRSSRQADRYSQQVCFVRREIRPVQLERKKQLWGDFCVLGHGIFSGLLRLGYFPLPPKSLKVTFSRQTLNRKAR